jgi:choice-of-anchor A domain-containing protein
MNIPGQAKNFSLYGLPTSTAISYAGNSAFIGTIYAPQATVSLVGTSDAMGAFVAKDMSLSGGMGIHYDEALRGNPKEGRYLVASWQEI